MSANILSFISLARRKPVFDAPRLLAFVTREEFARREAARAFSAYGRWKLEQRALAKTAQMVALPVTDVPACAAVERSSSTRPLRVTLGETVLRVGVPHPMTRVVGWCRRSVGRFLDGLQTVLSPTPHCSASRRFRSWPTRSGSGASRWR